MRLISKEDNKIVYGVPSSTEKGLEHRVSKLTTISNTIVYTCDCIGYQTRRKENPFFECKHIKAVKEYEDNKVGTIKGIIYLVIGFSILSFVSFCNPGVEQTEPACEIVDGNNHLYRGQCLPDGYEPYNLSLLSPRASWLNTEQYLDIRAKKVVEKLINDAEKDGMCLVVSSGYRTAEEQQEIYDLAESKSMVAKPNESEHQTGLAVDFVACPMTNGRRDDTAERLELEKPFEELPEFEWLQDNAWKYNMEQSYRMDNMDKTEYPVESWHWKLIIE